MLEVEKWSRPQRWWDGPGIWLGVYDFGDKVQDRDSGMFVSQNFADINSHVSLFNGFLQYIIYFSLNFSSRVLG